VLALHVRQPNKQTRTEREREKKSPLFLKKKQDILCCFLGSNLSWMNKEEEENIFIDFSRLFSFYFSKPQPIN